MHVGHIVKRSIPSGWLNERKERKRERKRGVGNGAIKRHTTLTVYDSAAFSILSTTTNPNWSTIPSPFFPTLNSSLHHPHTHHQTHFVIFVFIKKKKKERSVSTWMCNNQYWFWSVTGCNTYFERDGTSLLLQQTEG